jgi:predicted lipoprotein with Yx(FWY)xxD motif
MSSKTRIVVEILLAALLTLLLAGCGQATVAPTATPAIPAVVVNAANNPILGNILVDSAGMTLYLYTKDTSGMSNCSGQCAVNWPPLLVPAGAKVQAGSGVTAALGTIQRPDGTTQVAVGGMPLYYFIKDKASGDVTGQGVGGIWFVVSPDGSMVKTALPTVAPTATP